MCEKLIVFQEINVKNSIRMIKNFRLWENLVFKKKKNV